MDSAKRKFPLSIVSGNTTSQSMDHKNCCVPASDMHSLCLCCGGWLNGPGESIRRMAGTSWWRQLVYRIAVTAWPRRQIGVHPGADRPAPPRNAAFAGSGREGGRMWRTRLRIEMASVGVGVAGGWPPSSEETTLSVPPSSCIALS